MEKEKDGGNSFEDSPSSERRSTSPEEIHEGKVCDIIYSNRWLTLWEVPDEVGIFKKSCCGILTEHLSMRCVASKYVQQSVDWRAKTKWLEVSQEHFGSANNDENLCKKMSLQVKRYGFTAMLLKQKTTLNNGSQKPQTEPKNQGKFSQM